MAGDLQIVPFGREHLPGVIDLFAQEHWSYAQDEQRAWRALTAPGSLTLIALYDEELAGVAQILSDGEIQAFLAILLVAVGHRRKGIARRLLDETLARTQGQRLDLISCADSFYESLGFRTVSGFRLNRDPS